MCKRLMRLRRKRWVACVYCICLGVSRCMYVIFCVENVQEIGVCILKDINSVEVFLMDEVCVSARLPTEACVTQVSIASPHTRVCVTKVCVGFKYVCIVYLDNTLHLHCITSHTTPHTHA